MTLSNSFTALALAMLSSKRELFPDQSPYGGRAATRPKPSEKDRSKTKAARKQRRKGKRK